MQIIDRMTMKSFILFICLVCPLFVFASENGCGVAASTLEFNLCVKQAKNSADSKLNVSYKRLIARVNAQYQRDSELGAKFLVKLKASQLAWLKLRDTNCAIEAFEYDEAMPAYEVTVNNCVTKMSLDRSNYLDSTFPDNYNTP
ncbi:lysozyme inhibitor LprI family protein [Pseudomonas frederiksbergensis]|uniref:lysozyme inhibitor LprI family protein n=1 Tax=Pseudomonas frederiksbergensis TaxID=104087 RepID=UPI003D1B402B